MNLHKKYVEWVGTCRQESKPKGIVHYCKDDGEVFTWAWTFSDTDNLIRESDGEKAIDKRLQANGYSIIVKEHSSEPLGE